MTLELSISTMVLKISGVVGDFMSQFTYSDKELEVNKVLKMNQEISCQMITDADKKESRKLADDNIEASLKLLQFLGKSVDLPQKKTQGHSSGYNKPPIENWDSLVHQANEFCPDVVVLEDIMTDEEINASFREAKEINRDFSQKTSIINKIDLSFLTIAIALQVTKSLVFPMVAGKFGYGEQFDPADRRAHNDKSIEQEHRRANDAFRDKHLKNHKTGHWIELLYLTPAYDITRGSKELGINMGGAYHRMYTLGHDPILGWIFGTMNILTDVITLNTFQSFRVTRNPMCITKEQVPLWTMFSESVEWIKADPLNLPAAVFAQAQHLKSDEYTKIGLPIPLLSSINKNFASKLYKSHYDALCFARDVKIVGTSFIVSKIFDMIITLAHGMFRGPEENQDLYEARTRKILLISNTIASSSTIIQTAITKKCKDLDIGSLLNTLIHLFADVRFVNRIKQEFVQNEISNRLQNEIDEIDHLYEQM